MIGVVEKDFVEASAILFRAAIIKKPFDRIIVSRQKLYFKLLLVGMRRLASKIERGLQSREWRHHAVYEDELQRIWPSTEKDREAKIAQFAKEYGFRLRHYKAGLCAIFDKPRTPPKRPN